MPNKYDLAEKRVVVTGGASGIGLAVVKCLVASGAIVWVWDIDPCDVEGVTWTKVDITSPTQIEKAIKLFLDQFPQLDILVNSAGYLGMMQCFADHSSVDWLKIVQVNLMGTMTVTQLVLPLINVAGGRIINLGSLAGKEGYASLAAYSAASAGVIAFTKSLGRELAGSGILVNCVAPGPIDTGMIRGLGQEAVNTMVDASPLMRLGSAEEVANLVAWLCSEASSFNTGAVFDVSGGRAHY